MLSPETEAWLRHGYRARMNTEAVLRDLGAILAHGEPETASARARAPTPPPTPPKRPPPTTPRRRRRRAGDAPTANGNGAGELVAVDFGGLGPAGPDAA